MITINGYAINSQFKDLTHLVQTLLKHPISVKSSNEAKAILRLLGYIGVKHLTYDISPALEINLPRKGRANHVYRLMEQDNEIIVNMMPTNLYERQYVTLTVVPASQIIVGKSPFAAMRDWTCNL